jgi:hypothetical protein
MHAKMENRNRNMMHVACIHRYDVFGRFRTKHCSTICAMESTIIAARVSSTYISIYIYRYPIIYIYSPHIYPGVGVAGAESNDKRERPTILQSRPHPRHRQCPSDMPGVPENG